MNLNKYIILIVVIYSSVYSCKNIDDMVEFKPIVSKNGHLKEDVQDIESDFFDNLKVVLDYYNVDYKFEDGIILVKKEVYKEKELMMNYTIKARDSNWLSSIK